MMRIMVENLFGSMPKIGCLVCTQLICFAFHFACAEKRDIGSSARLIHALDQVSIGDQNFSSGSDFRQNRYDAALPVSWPPLPTPAGRDLPINPVESNHRAPPLIIYSRPRSPPASGLQIKNYQYPVQPSANSTQNSNVQLGATSSTPPSAIYGPAANASATKHPLINLFSNSTKRQNKDKNAVFVLTTPFGVAWRQAANFVNELSTTSTSTPQSEPPSTLSTLSTSQATATAFITQTNPITSASIFENEQSHFTPPPPRKSIEVFQGTPPVSKRPTIFSHTKYPQSTVANRIKGKPHILCMGNGIMFIAETYFAFDGLVFAKDHENRSNCSYSSIYNKSEIVDRSINVSFPYADCGEPVKGKKGDHMFQTNVVVSFRDGRVQTFLARCVSQKLHYEDEDLPQKIEEALEELNITPIKAEKQAPMPMCTMRVVREFEHAPHQYGPSNGSAVNDAFIGQQLRMEFALDPPSAAFGFLIRNCTVLDTSVDARYVIIDDKGCSVDINIFAHPHYDTYHDLAVVHWHAFKVPDSASLSFQCDCVVCTDFVDDDSGQTSCEQIPTPPICPDIVTSSTLQNALIFDQSQNQVFKKKRHVSEQNLRAGFCLSKEGVANDCNVSSVGEPADIYVNTTDENDFSWTCFSKLTFAVCLGFNLALLLSSISIFLELIPYQQSKYSTICFSKRLQLFCSTPREPDQVQAGINVENRIEFEGRLK